MNGFTSIILLIVSNVFMTFAWYGHLRFKSVALWEVILVSWLIAFFEYCFQVPANRIGSYQYSPAQLKVIQEVISLAVFGGFSILYLKEQFRWNYLVAFALIVAAVIAVFAGGGRDQKTVSKLNDTPVEKVSGSAGVRSETQPLVATHRLSSYKE